MVDWKMKHPGKKYNFCCVNNWQHYRVFYVHWEQPFNIEYETVILYEGKHKYEIHQYETDVTNMLVYKVDPEGRVLDEKVPPLAFSYRKKLFDFSHTNREKLLHRVRTILVFQ